MDTYFKTIKISVLFTLLLSVMDFVHAGWDLNLVELENQLSEIAELGSPCEGGSDGCPEWSVNKQNLNVYIEDTPLWFQPPSGSKINFKLIYNSQGTYNDPSTSVFGSHFKTNFQAYVEVINGEHFVVYPDGRRNKFKAIASPVSPSSDRSFYVNHHGEMLTATYSPSNPSSIHYYNLTLQNNETLQFKTKINSQYHLSKIYSKGMLPRLLIRYSNNKLSQVVEVGGKGTYTMNISYLSNGLSITANDGRSAQMTRSGNVITLKDMEGLNSMLTLNGDNVVTALTKPESGQWTFQENVGDTCRPSDRIKERKVTVNHPDGRVDTYAYQRCHPVTNITYTKPSGDTINETLFFNYEESTPTTKSFRITRIQGFYLHNSQVTDNSIGVEDVVEDTYFDPESRVVEHRDAAKKTTTYEYDFRGQVIKKTESGANHVRETSFSDYGALSVNMPRKIQRPSVYGTNKQLTLITYGVWGLVEGITVSGFDPAGSAVSRSLQYVYDTQQRITQINGPRSDVNDVTSFSYYADCSTRTNTCGRLKTLTDAKGHVTTFNDYNAYGLPIQITDVNGLVSTISYDKLERIKSITQGAGASQQQMQYTYYGAKEQLKTRTFPNGLTVVYEYNTAAQLIAERFYPTAAIGTELYRIQYTYDTRGNVSKRAVVNSSTSNTELDITYEHPADDMYNRLSAIKAQNRAPTTSYVYSGADGWTAQVRNNGEPNADYVYDAFARLQQMQYIERNASAYFIHDIQDNLTRVTAANGAVTTYSYDDLGNRITETSADRGALTYTYDAAGNVTSMRDARNITVNYSYDVLNRVTLANYPGTEEDITYQYDTCVGQGYVKGRLCQITDQSGVHRYSYDIFGNLTQDSFTSAKTAQVYTTAYSYDAMNRIIEMTYPSGKKLRYTRDALGYVNHVQGVATGFLSFFPADLVTNRLFRYDGQLLEQTFSGRVIEKRAYSTAGDLIGQTVKKTDGASIVGVEDALYGVSIDKGYYQQTPSLDFNLIIKPTFNNQWIESLQNRAYTYDHNGNRTAKQISGWAVGLGEANVNYVYATNSNKLQSKNAQAVSVDASGNVLSDKNDAGRVRTLTYNNAGLLKTFAMSAQGSNAATNGSYVYDYSRLRRFKQSTETVTSSTQSCVFIFFCSYTHTSQIKNVQREFIYDQQGRLLAEYKDGTLDREYAWDDRLLLGMQQGNDVYGIITDYLGTPRVMLDSNGVLAWRWTDHGFGTDLVSGQVRGNQGPYVEMPLRYAGQYADAESGLFYNWNRYYDPKAGRYIQSDPIGLAGGLNTYAYAGNDPFNKVDPEGLFAPLLWMAGYAALELGLAAYDAYDTASTLVDPCSSGFEKGAAAGLFLLGAVAPGGGYSKLDDVAKGADKFVDGYRAVSKAEADDIAKYGFRPNPNGQSMQDKWFSETRQGAEKFKQNYSDLNDVVKAKVPRDVYEQSYKHPNIDNTGPGFCVACYDLSRLKAGQ